MLTLGIESSCDDTSVAILDGDKILANVVASQTIHKKFGGVVPELASRQHVVAIDSVIKEALSVSDKSLGQLDLIAATHAPGLVGGLLVGMQAAKGLALGSGVPFLGVHHLEGHLSATFLTDDPVVFPHLALVVSGGHSQIILAEKFGRYKLVGGTRDDAAGEAFDKVAKILGLGYPGGRYVDERAKLGNPTAVPFRPIMTLKKSGLDFSFSGLKTAVRNYLIDNPSLDEQGVNDLCASFQHTVVEVLVRKTTSAVKMYNVPAVQVCGGVACNSGLRTAMRAAGAEHGFSVHIAKPALCTDNGAMIAAAAHRRFAISGQSPMSLSPQANFPLDTL